MIELEVYNLVLGKLLSYSGCNIGYNFFFFLVHVLQLLAKKGRVFYLIFSFGEIIFVRIK